MNTNGISIRERIIHSPVSQERLALDLGVSPAYLSRCLNGLRPMPEGMEKRIHAALGRLEAAERAADEARARVLAGDGE